MLVKLIRGSQLPDGQRAHRVSWLVWQKVQVESMPSCQAAHVACRSSEDAQSLCCAITAGAPLTQAAGTRFSLKPKTIE